MSQMVASRRRRLQWSFSLSLFLCVGLMVSAAVLPLIGVAQAQSSHRSDEGAHILALDNSWNRALESKDIKALDMLLADTLVSVDIDGSMQSKSAFLASI